MLQVSTPTYSSPSFAARKEAQPQSAAHMADMPAFNVLIVPIYDDIHHGADLLMIPISDNKSNKSNKTGRDTKDSDSRTESPAAPTPPPKPELPKGCQDWDAFLSQKKSTATLPRYDPEAVPETSPRIQSPELNFKHSFEHLGWRDCLAQSQRQRSHARALRRRPSLAATVIGTYSNTASSAASLRSAKRLSNASTLTANTAATAPCYLGSASYKRLSAASTLTTSTTSSMGKPRSLRRINRARHLRAYYSDGSLLRATRRLSVGISSMQDITERREPLDVAAVPRAKRLSAVSMLSSEYQAPPPYPPPEKPLPSLPVMEIQELQTGERVRWRELLLRSFQRRDGSRRRGTSTCRA